MITFDPEQLQERAAALEQEMGAPGFWDDQQRAAAVSAEHARLTKRLDRYQRLTREYEDARDLLALDDEMEDEIAESIAPLRKAVSFPDMGPDAEAFLTVALFQSGDRTAACQEAAKVKDGVQAGVLDDVRLIVGTCPKG